MKTPARNLITLITLFSAISMTSYGQSKWDKLMDKSEAPYEEGDYVKAQKSLDKAKSKTAKKLGALNPYTPTQHVLQAKLYLATGLIPKFETSLEQALTTSVALHLENSKENALVLAEAARLQVQNRSYKAAKELLSQSIQILETGGLLDESLAAQLDLDMAEILTAQGYYNEAVSMLRERERYFGGRALPQETYVDENGSLKSRKLPDEEKAVRYQEYARLLTLLGDAYRNKGNLISADSAFVFAETWIDDNLSKDDLAYIKNQLMHAMLLIENGLDESLPRELDYSRILNYLKVQHESSHYLAIPIYEAYLDYLLQIDNTSRYLNTKLEFERMINSSYENTSIYRARLEAVEFDAKLDNDRMFNLERNATNLLNNKNLPRNNITTVRVLEFLYELAVKQKNFESAEQFLNDVITIKNELYGEDTPEVHLSKINLANFYLDNTNKITEATKIYDESFTNVVSKQIGAWHKDHLEILNHMATLYELTDQYTEASTTLARAGEVARAKYRDTDYEYGNELNKIARLEMKLGQYEEAEDKISSALQILEPFRRDDSKNIYLVDTYETQAILLGIQGLFDDAEDVLDQSSKIIRRSANLADIDELTSALELANLQIQLGRFSRVEDLLLIMIPEYQSQYGNNSIRLIDPLVNRSKLNLAKGDYTTAEQDALRANQIALSVYGEKSTKTAPTQRALSDVYYTIGDYDKSQTYIERALASQEDQFGRNHIEVAKSLSQLGLIRFYKGDSKTAIEKILLEARDIMGNKLGQDNPQYAEILKDVAQLYLSDKKYDLTITALNTAEKIWLDKTDRRNINLASIWTLMGDVYYDVKNYPRANEYYTKAITRYRRDFSKNHPEYVKVLSKMAKVSYMEKDYKVAKNNIEEALENYDSFIKQYFPALSEREKAKYWNTIKGDFEFYNTLAFSNLDDFKDLSGKVYNYQLMTKALLLSSSIKIRERILNSQDEELKSAYTQWLEEKESLTNAISMSTQQLTEAGIDVVGLSAQVEKLEKELSLKSELFSQGFEDKRITYEDVQKSLKDNEVAVEMVRFRYFDHVFTDSIIYVSLYVRNDRSRPKVIELPQGHLMETRYFRYYRNAMEARLPDGYSYGVFWQPIQSAIGQYSTLYLSPDGVYNQLNLEAIPTPDGKYVIDNANIVIVSNTKDLHLRSLRKRPVTASRSATMFGNPTFYLTASTNATIPSLPGTEKEVDELESLLQQNGWNTTEYVKVEASEDRIKELNSPRIFHVATHGFYTPEIDQDGIESEVAMTENPLLKTGLLLKGAGDVLNKTKYNYNIESGILTAYEAMSLNLDQTDLVVLSACETGLGEISNGEGVYGLQRAFLVAGAKVLVMSMFKVDDAATQELILNFYRKWLTSGNLRSSFIDAKKELRVKYPDPIFWGAFMMIGLE